MTRPTDTFRDLTAIYWKPVSAIIVAVLAAVGGIISQFGKQVAHPVVVYGVILIALLAAVRIPRIALFITRVILGPPSAPPLLPRLFRGIRPYTSEDQDGFYGRLAETDDCWLRIQHDKFLVIDGESGCGKSSLLRAGLIPRLEKLHRVVEYRMGHDPIDSLRAALGGVLNEPNGGLIFHSAGISAARAETSKAAGETARVTVCVDQVEEFFFTVKDEDRSRLFNVLKHIIQSANVAFIFCVRSDFLDLLLKHCRDSDPDQDAFNLGNLYTLGAFSKLQAEEVLRKILAPLSEGDPLARQQSNDFIEALTSELLRPPRDPRLSREDKQTVLPVQLQMMGVVLESSGVETFTSKELRKQGGRLGLLRLFLADAAIYAWRKTGVPDTETLRILRRLVSPSGTSLTLTSAEIAPAFNRSVAEVTRVLDAYCDNYLVQREPPAADGLPRYRLMHDYLGSVLLEAPIPVLQQARDSEERLAFWLARAHGADTYERGEPKSVIRRMASAWSQQVPIAETMRLWRYSFGDARRFLTKNLRAFILRTVLALFVLALGPLGYAVWAASDRYQIEQTVSDGEALVAGSLDSKESLSHWAVAAGMAGYTTAAFDATAKLRANEHVSPDDLTLFSLAEAFAQLGDRANAERAATAIEGDTRKAAIQTVAQGLALSGTIDKVDGVLSQLGEDEKIQRRVRIASLLVDAGRKAEARALLPNDEEIAGIHNLDNRVSTLADLTYVLSKAGSGKRAMLAWQQALAGARQMEPDEDGLERVALRASEEAGMESQAAVACADIHNPYVVVTELPPVALNLAKRGAAQSASDLMEKIAAAAVQTAGRASSADGREALGYALGLAWAGRPAEAIIPLMTDVSAPAALAADAAVELEELGRTDLANSFWIFGRSRWAHASDPGTKEDGFVELAAALILAKRYEDLKALIDDFWADPSESNFKVDGLYLVLAKMVDPSRSDHQLVPILQSVAVRLVALPRSESFPPDVSIVQLLTEAGELQQALIVAQRTPGDRVEALSVVAEAFVSSGDKESGRKVFGDAEKMAEAERFKSFSLLWISEAYARLGEYRNARSICQSCENEQRLESDAWILAEYGVRKHPNLLRICDPKTSSLAPDVPCSAVRAK